MSAIDYTSRKNADGLGLADSCMVGGFGNFRQVEGTLEIQARSLVLVPFFVFKSRRPIL